MLFITQPWPHDLPGNVSVATTDPEWACPKAIQQLELKVVQTGTSARRAIGVLRGGSPDFPPTSARIIRPRRGSKPRHHRVHVQESEISLVCVTAPGAANGQRLISVSFPQRGPAPKWPEPIPWYVRWRYTISHRVRGAPLVSACSLGGNLGVGWPIAPDHASCLPPLRPIPFKPPSNRQQPSLSPTSSPQPIQP